MPQRIAWVLLALVFCLTHRAFGDPDEILHATSPQRWIDAVTPEQLPPMTYPAYFNDLDKAKAESFHGRYKLSLFTLGRVHAQGPEQVALVARVRAASQAGLGQLDDALATLSDAAVADDGGVQTQRAELLERMGKPADAITLLKANLEKHPDSMSAHYLLGQANEQLGDIPAATANYAWFVNEPQKFLSKWETHDPGPFDKADEVTAMGRGIDRWATLTEAYRDNTTLHKTILSMFVRAYDVIDRGYWPAHVAAAEYFNSHDEKKEAGEELGAALGANPNDVVALSLVGQLHLDQFDFDGADKMLAAIRSVNDNSIEADLLEARNLLLQRRPADAEAPVRAALAIQPGNTDALGLLAAVYALQLKEDQTAEVLKQVDQINPHNATAFFEVAQQLGAMRQYPRAAERYKQAIARAPWWTAAQNGLGLLYTQSGEEDLARVVITNALKLDPFNLATTNYMKLLDMMDGFARKETDHFIVMYDDKQDPIIPEYFSDYLESVQADVCATFHYTPTVKTIIEVFPTHAGFSVRTTGSPWIGTVGASTGRIIAMVAPRVDKNTMGPFNWSQVLRHEYTHTVTLGATDNRIQHWMTEGLAVYEEQSPLRWEWVPMLYNAVKKKELFPLDKLTWSFVRPKRPIDRQLAYAESYWIIKYVEETYGHETILKMLDDFRNAERQEDVFPKETHRTMPQFQAEFFAWCEQQTASWGYDQESTAKYNDLLKKAEDLTKARQFAEAAEIWEQIAVLRPVDSLPHQRLAGIYLSKAINQPDKAIPHLLVLQKVELKDNRFAKRIARLYRDEGKFDEAAKYGLQAVYIDPYDIAAHETLEAAYEKLNNQPGLDREKRVLAILQKAQDAKDNPKPVKPE